MKEFIVKLFANFIGFKIERWKRNPNKTQEKIFRKLIKKGSETIFGQDHNFDEIKSYEDFKRNVPIRDYEQIRNYIERIKKGEPDVLWPGKPIYFCKTSGTTSGIKYIPLTKDSLPNHLNSARNALLNYILETGNLSILKGKMIFIQGSPVLDSINGIPSGRLSGIVAHHVPTYLQGNRMPSMKTNCVKDWELKIDAIVDETIREDMTLIGGIPSWVQMYFIKLIERSGKKHIKDIFPNFNLLVTGGVNFAPYVNIFNQLIGKSVDRLELYPASEGFFAYQDSQAGKDLLLLLKDGIFYEFIEMRELKENSPARLSINDVKLDVNYALVINSNAGLWGYLIGDTIKFTSLHPRKIVVTGRIDHFTSAFGEHIISEEVESAISEINTKEKVEIVEFTVAPQVNPPIGELPFHEWYIEFKVEPTNMHSFAQKLDKIMQTKNLYYKDLIQGHVLQSLKVNKIVLNGFQTFMKEQGKLGGQNKMVRLSNDRTIAEKLNKYLAC